MLLGYLLGRCGIETLVLESQEDFDRDFRGDTLHAGVVEILDAMGLSGRLFALPHYKIGELGAGGANLVDFSCLKTEFPFVTMMAQSVFLDFMARESQTFPSFHIEMGASARELVRDESGRIVGLSYRKCGELAEVRTVLVVACDGRGSRLRKEAGLELEEVTDPLEILWFRLPRFAADEGAIRSGILTGGRLPLILLERPDRYQIAAVIEPGRYSEIRAEGLPAFHERLREAEPRLFERAVDTLTEWKKIAFLHVVGGRLETWHIPGMLLIGDAAHVMTPVGGVGINYAIWDAVETANVIVPALKSGAKIDEQLLAEIQRRRERPTRIMQAIQRIAGRRVLNIVAADETKRLRIPLVLRLFARVPGVRSLLPRMVALGGRRTQCEIASFFET